MVLIDHKLVFKLSDYDGAAKLLDNEILVYQPSSGCIRLIDQLGLELLNLLQHSPQPAEQLIAAIKTNFNTSSVENLDTAILNTISQFQSIDLIEPDV